MLIQLDNSLEQELSVKKHKLNENSSEVMALNNLAIAYRNGWHIIIGPLHVLNFIKNIEHIDNSTKRVFDKLIKEYAFQKSYKDVVGEYILVRGLDGNVTRIDEKESEYHYEVPLNYFFQLSKCMKTSLLCEDESDFNFYKKLCEKYLKENKEMLGIELAVKFSNGGGVNSYRVLERGVLEDCNPVLAIADSDKKYPESTIGQTLKKLLEIERRHMNSKILNVYSLPVRAKENLIPPSLYLQVGEHTFKDHLEKLQFIEKKNSEKLLYFNIKDGYKVKHFKDEKFMKFFRGIFIETEKLLSCAIEDISLKTDDDEIVVNGLKGLVDRFTDTILDGGIEKKLQKKRSLQDPPPQVLESIMELEDLLKLKEDLFNNLPSYISEILIELCKKILSWGCSKGETYGTLGA